MCGGQRYPYASRSNVPIGTAAFMFVLRQALKRISVMFEIMGLIGSLTLCISALPQIVKTYRTKKADDLSISYLIILMLGMALMMIYSLHIGDPIFIFGNSLSVLSTGVLIFLCLRYRSQFMA